MSDKTQDRDYHTVGRTIRKDIRLKQKKKQLNKGCTSVNKKITFVSFF